MTRHPTVGELVERLAEPLKLDDLGNGIGLDRPLPGPDISSPGLALAGYVGRFVSDRLQVLGETEISYLYALDDARRKEIIDIFFSFDLPAVFVTKAQEPPEGLLERARESGTAVIRTALSTAEFYRGVKPALEELFAPTTTLHGSLADVYGVGLFFTGGSGIGKSECVLDLVERGHRLVADDLVIVSRRGQDLLIGRAHELAAHHMEIRGVGLINIPSIFGIRSVRQQKRIEVVVHLEAWDKNAPVERTGLDMSTAGILGVEIPKITIPLNPGKNITVIAEVIAMNHLLQYSGINPAEQFNDRLIQRMQKASAIRRYLQEDVE
ncbi:MAG: HPr(Ser) kinase/phosphatase [Gemmatimonadota bacterium]|nr:HPr(Ser) kinase/phosphatase [Gemmatimonadota bacterium]